MSQAGQMIIESSWLISYLCNSNHFPYNIEQFRQSKWEKVRCYVMKVISSQFFLQLVNSPHFFQHFILSIIFAFQPFLSKYLTIRYGLAEGDGVDEAVFEDSRVGANAWYIVCVVVLAEITKFIRNIEIVELVSD